MGLKARIIFEPGRLQSCLIFFGRGTEYSINIVGAELGEFTQLDDWATADELEGMGHLTFTCLAPILICPISFLLGALKLFCG